MSSTPIPANEQQRLAAVRAYPSLDGFRDAWGDECAKIASVIADCPIAVISIVEQERLWFLGGHGVPTDETPRVTAFCSHTITRRSPLIIPDATLEPGFCDNPFVRGEPGIRFYAGIPLIDGDGMVLGTLCVIHLQPHEISAAQLWALRTLSRLVIEHITRRRNNSDSSISIAMGSEERDALIAARSRLEAEIAHRDALFRKLDETARLAEAANHAKSAFLANMSHEVRTPLAAILGYADLLAEENGGVLGVDERRLAIESIRRNGRHLLNIINDVLDISKIEAGKFETERIPTPIRSIVEQVVGTLGDRLRQPGVEITIEHGMDVPRNILSDPTRVRQILTNLIGNALKFTSRGSVTIRTSTQAALPDSEGCGTLRIDVIDTGIGIEAHQIKDLFQPFSQGDSSFARRYGGTGLGLSISSELAKALGGSVRAWSTAGKGSRFALTIPLEACEVESGGEVDAAARGSAGLPDVLRGRRILLVEDGLDNQRLISHHLKRVGAAVEIADNGEVGVEAVLRAAAGACAFDLIVMDIQMPLLDGYGATRRLRERGIATPIIALTAHAMDGERERCLAAGCDDFLTKPIDASALIRCCAFWIERRVCDHRAA